MELMQNLEVADEESFKNDKVTVVSSTPYTDATKCTKKKKVNHVKRPMNAFMVWSQGERQNITKNFPNMHNAEISKLLGMRWKDLSSEKKKQFTEKAEELRILHLKEFPGYKYKPQKKLQKLQKKPIVNPFHKKRLESLIQNVENVIQDHSQAKVATATADAKSPAKKSPSQSALSSFSFSLYEGNLAASNKPQSQAKPHEEKPAELSSAKKQELRRTIRRLLKAGRFTSGPICKVASDSDNPIQTFDYLVQSQMNQNPGALAAEMSGLYRDYHELAKQSSCLSNNDEKYETEDLRIPDIEEILTWKAL